MFKYNEKAYAEYILNNGFTSKHINTELKVLAKYYKHLNIKPKEREELLYKFCEEHIAGFSRVKFFKKINQALNHARKKENQLIVIEEIPVTKGELDFIDGLDLDIEYKKVLLTLTVLVKLNKEVQKIRNPKVENDEFYFGGNQKSYKELVDAAKIPQGKSKKIKKIHDIIGELHNLGIVEIRSNGFIKLNYMYMLEKSVELISIDDFTQIGYFYEEHLGSENIFRCSRCSVIIRKVSNKQKYCKGCAESKEKERKRDWKRKKINNSSEIEKP